MICIILYYYHTCSVHYCILLLFSSSFSVAYSNFGREMPRGKFFSSRKFLSKVVPMTYQQHIHVHVPLIHVHVLLIHDVTGDVERKKEERKTCTCTTNTCTCTTNTCTCICTTNTCTCTTIHTHVHIYMYYYKYTCLSLSSFSCFRIAIYCETFIFNIF